MRIILLLISTVIATGCAHNLPSQIAGQRINSEGQVVQQIIRDETAHTHTVLGPDGPRERTRISCKFYFVENGQPKRRFFIGDSSTQNINLLNEFLAVSNSPLWVATEDVIIWTNRPSAAHVVETNLLWHTGKPYTSYQVNDLYIYVFDDKGYFLQRVFMVLQKGETKFMPEGETYSGEYSFENGNQRIVFKSPTGIKKYDVLADKVRDEDPVKQNAK